jgi:hypothetical protein
MQLEILDIALLMQDWRLPLENNMRVEGFTDKEQTQDSADRV